MRLQGSSQESKRGCEDETDLHWCTSSKRPISDVRAEKQLHVSPRRHLVTTAFLRVSN
jgi:hypothetical protein